MRSKLWSPAVWPGMGSIVLAISLSLSAAIAPLELGVKGRGNATPTIAADGPFVAVTWGGTLPSGTTDVFTAVSRDGGPMRPVGSRSPSAPRSNCRCR